MKIFMSILFLPKLQAIQNQFSFSTATPKIPTKSETTPKGVSLSTTTGTTTGCHILNQQREYQVNRI